MIPPYDYASRPVPNSSSVWMYGRMHFFPWIMRLVPKVASWPAKTWFFSQASRSVPIYTGRLKPKGAAEMKTPTCWNLDPAHPIVKKGEKGRDSRRLFHDKLRMSVQATSKKRPHHNFVQQRLIANAPRESKSLALENEKGLERTRSCGSLPQCRTFPWKLLPPCTCEWPCALPISSSHALYASCHAFQNKLGTVSR